MQPVSTIKYPNVLYLELSSCVSMKIAEVISEILLTMNTSTSKREV